MNSLSTDDLHCPLCGWESPRPDLRKNRNAMSIHISCHDRDEVNAAVDDGRLIENPIWYFTPKTES